MRKIIEFYHRHEIVRLMVGDGGVYKEPSLVTTILGSCVSVTFHCHAKKIGAIFHAVLPIMPDKEKTRPIINHFKYVDSSIHYIIHSLQERGIKHNQIEAKLFGGSHIFCDRSIRTGSSNIKTAYEVLAAYKIKIISSDIGGNRGRNLIFISNTGEVFIRNHKANIFDSGQKKNESD